VGLFGLQIIIPLVFGVISFSNSSMGGSANPSSIFAAIDLITAPATIANAS